MDHWLSALEARRTIMQLEISRLGDMRCGSISGTSGKGGHPRCHCH